VTKWKRTPDGWWQPVAAPDGGMSLPPWVPVDLAASGCSEIILIRSDGSIRRALVRGPATLSVPLPPDETDPLRPPGERVALVPVGQTRIVALPDPEPQWVIR
jgi:hypothetical protein